jgi:hypothetical protein
MSFSLPTFNLLCNIFTGPWPVGPPRAMPLCNLALGRRVTGNYQGGATSVPIYLGYSPLLLLPPATDIRDGSCGVVPDYVEVPAGTGRFYQVGWVDDIGKGFANEHRYAAIFKVFQNVAGGGSFPGFYWPTPMP